MVRRGKYFRTEKIFRKAAANGLTAGAFLYYNISVVKK